LICFDVESNSKCEIFDGINSTKTFSSRWEHYQGGLGLYKGRPATIGGYLENKAETLIETGWIKLPHHPATL
jgi:hypothetical protein